MCTAFAGVLINTAVLFDIYEARTILAEVLDGWMGTNNRAQVELHKQDL